MKPEQLISGQNQMLEYTATTSTYHSLALFYSLFNGMNLKTGRSRKKEKNKIKKRMKERNKERERN